MNREYDKIKMGKRLSLLFCLCAAVYLLLLYVTNQRVAVADVSGADQTAADDMEYKIERVRLEDGYLDIRGYAYEPGESVDVADTTVLAYDAAADVYYRLPTEHVKKAKLTKNADDGYNYDYAQFQSITRASKIPGGCTICIWYRGNGKNRLIRTDRTILQGTGEDNG